MLNYLPGKKANQIVIVADHFSGRFTSEQRKKMEHYCSDKSGVICKFNPLSSRCTITFETSDIQNTFLKDFSTILKEIS